MGEMVPVKPAEDSLAEFDTEEHRRLFASVVAPGAPPGMVTLIYHYGRMLGLDPLLKQVMLVEMKRKNDHGAWVTENNIIINVHGFVKICAREPDYCGMTSAAVYPGEACTIAADGTVTHTQDIAKRAEMFAAGTRVLPVGAWCTVLRRLNGEVRKFSTFVPFVECAQYRWDDQAKKKVLRSTWAGRPSWMNEKCAIGHSARKAYDDRVGGPVYVAEEFGGVSNPDGSVSFAPDAVDEVVDSLPPGDDYTPAKHGQGEVSEPENEALDGMGYRPIEQPAPDERTADERLTHAVMRAEMLFKEPSQRTFLLERNGHVWVQDAEALRRLSSPAPLLLSRLTDGQKCMVAVAIESIADAEEARHGR